MEEPKKSLNFETFYTERKKNKHIVSKKKEKQTPQISEETEPFKKLLFFPDGEREREST